MLSGSGEQQSKYDLIPLVWSLRKCSSSRSAKQFGTGSRKSGLDVPFTQVRHEGGLGA